MRYETAPAFIQDLIGQVKAGIERGTSVPPSLTIINPDDPEMMLHVAAINAESDDVTRNMFGAISGAVYLEGLTDWWWFFTADAWVSEGKENYDQLVETGTGPREQEALAVAVWDPTTRDGMELSFSYMRADAGIIWSPTVSEGPAYNNELRGSTLGVMSQLTNWPRIGMSALSHFGPEVLEEEYPFGMFLARAISLPNVKAFSTTKFDAVAGVGMMMAGVVTEEE